MDQNHAEEITIPEAAGSITNRIAAAPGAPLVVHIADAHCNAPVQRNIAAVGRHLVDQHGFRLFAVEGTPGAIDVSVPRLYYSDAPAAIDQQLESGRITGPEWLAISHARALTIHGIEDADAYRRNHQAMLGVLHNAQPARARERGVAAVFVQPQMAWTLVGLLNDNEEQKYKTIMAKQKV